MALVFTAGSWAVQPVALEASHAAKSAVVLGAVNSIRGSGAGSVRVHVPEDATISRLPWDNPDLEVEGAGLFSGVVLVKDAPNRTGPALVAGRAPVESLCSGTDCLGTEYVVATMEPDDATPTYRIPAGAYVLYLIAYGSPVEVTLSLNGLSGSAELRPQGPADLSWHRMAPRLAVPAQSVYWDGAYRPMEGPGMVFVWSALVSQHVLNDEMVHCSYAEEPPPPTAYVPGCPGGSQIGFSETRAGPGVWRHQMFGFDHTGGGGFGVGYWHAATHPVERTTALAFWLTYA